MITDMNARVAMAQKLSIPQLQQAIKNGTIPAYVGVPMLQDKMRQQQQMQMAAAQQQQGQQQQRPIAEEVMEQAGAMGGVDQLPSNLPIQNEEDEEGYAGGGIIAFAEPTAQNNNSRVTDPDVDVLERMRIEDPEGYKRVANPETASDRAAILNLIKKGWTTSQDIGSAGVRGLGTVADYFNRGLRAIGVPETVAPRLPGEYTFNRSNRGLTPYTDARVASEGGFEANYPVSSRAEAPAQEPEGSLTEGLTPASIKASEDQLPKAIAALPGATSSGAVSPDVARQISATNPGAPATLKDAERQAASGSPQASAAVSMLDRYVAMLEKSGDDVGRQKKEALYMALIQGGLGMMGGTSPNAFANISAGLLPATQAYQQAIAGIRKDDRQRLEKLMAAGISKEKLGMELRKLGIEEKKVDALVNYYNARAGAAGAGGSSKEDRLVRQGYEKSGVEYDSLARRARADMANALRNNLDYTNAKSRLAFPKNLKPAEKAALEKTIKDAEAPYLSQIQDYSNKSRYFMKQAGMDLSSGGGNKEDVDLNQFFK